MKMFYEVFFIDWNEQEKTHGYYSTIGKAHKYILNNVNKERIQWNHFPLLSDLKNHFDFNDTGINEIDVIQTREGFYCVRELVMN